MRQLETSCSGCGVLLASAQVLYNQQGDPICQSCTTKNDITAGHERSAQKAASLAYGNLLIGLASFGFDPFFILSAGAIGNCAYTFRRIQSELSRGDIVRYPTRQKVAAALGAVAAVGSLLWRILR